MRIHLIKKQTIEKFENICVLDRETHAAYSKLCKEKEQHIVSVY